MDHLTVIGGLAEQLRLEGQDQGGLGSQRIGEILDRNFRAFRHAGHIDHNFRQLIVGTGAGDQVEQVLGIAQGRQIRRHRHDHLVGREQGLAHPGHPQMRQIKRDERRLAANLFQHHFIFTRREFPIAVQRRRRRKQTQPLGTAHQKPVEQRIIEPVRFVEGIAQRLGRVLVEIEPGRAEGEIEIDEHRIGLQPFRQRPGAIMGHRRGADTALGADEGNTLAGKGLLGIEEQVGNRADQMQRRHRWHEILAHPALHQLAIEGNIIGGADDDNLGFRVTDARQLLELFEQALATHSRFHNQKIGRGRIMIALDRCGQPAELDADMRLGQAPVTGGIVDQRSGLGTFAEGGNRDPRHRLIGNIAIDLADQGLTGRDRGLRCHELVLQVGELGLEGILGLRHRSGGL